MSALPEGEVVAGRYRVVRELARGGMGVVYEATDLKFAIQVALKVVGATVSSASMRARFVREARLGGVLGRTAGFVRIFDWGELEKSGQVYLAMDLVPGANELDLTNGPLPERLERFTTAAKIVATAHRLGVIHRDLKPSNFLVARDGSIHLTDFGIAKALSEPDEEVAPGTADMNLTSTGTTMGTPHYMPPEMFEDAKKADARADVYALGVMLYLTLAGRMPYEGDNAASLIATQMKVRYQERPAPRARDVVQVPVALDQVCAKAMSLDAAARHADASELLEALERTEWRKALGHVRAPAAGPPTSLPATQLEGPDAAPAQGTQVSATMQDFAAAGRARCSACGAEDGVRGDKCVRCGAPSRGAGVRIEPRGKDLEPRPRGLSQKTLDITPAPPAPITRPRAEVGAGLTSNDGVAIPKGVWFVLGLLVVAGVALSRWHPTPPSTVVEHGKSGATTKTGQLTAPKGELVALEDVPDEDRHLLELFAKVHEGWRGRAAKEPELEEPADPFDLVDAATGAEARVTFTSLTCSREGRVGSSAVGVPVTEAETDDYLLRRVGSGSTEIRRRE